MEIVAGMLQSGSLAKRATLLRTLSLWKIIVSLTFSSQKFSLVNLSPFSLERSRCGVPSVYWRSVYSEKIVDRALLLFTS